MTIIIAILIFCFLILFHEFGHFFVAKRCGIRVNEFSLGLGPTLVGFTIGETKYSIKALPLGGACMMEGEDEASEDSRAFNNKPLWQRALVVFAGPLFNFILAFVLALILLGNIGVDEPVVADVSEGYPAQEAGIEPGDRIISMNHYPIDFYREISVFTYFHPNEDFTIVYERDGVRHETTLVPKYSEEDGRSLIGVVSSGVREKRGLLGTIQAALAEMKYQIYVVFKSIAMLLTGQVSVNDMSGPVGIVKTIGDTVKAAAPSGLFIVVMNILNITILLSANLGVMNLLPIPALDGGRLFIFLIEAIRRKKLPEEVEGRIHIVGFVILLGLMALIFFNDIRKLIM